MKNRKIRLILKTPANSLGDVGYYNISNTRRLYYVGDLFGVVRKEHYRMCDYV